MSRAPTVARVLVVLVCAALTPAAHAEPAVPLPELARDLRAFDGQRVTVEGTFSQVRTHISKKGVRSYSFRVSQAGSAIAVLMSTPPGCRPGSRVTAQGIVDGRARRVDATSVTCL